MGVLNMSKLELEELKGGKKRKMRGGLRAWAGLEGEGGKKRKIRGGQCGGPNCRLVFEGGQCVGPGCQNIVGGGQAGGAHSALSPASLSGDSFDGSGAQLAKTAHNLYVKQNYDLAAIKNVNAMKGGQTKMRGGRRLKRTAKKYSRFKSSKSARRGGGLVEAVVPLGLLAAQQTLFKRGSSKRYNKYGGSTRRSPFKF